MAAGGIGESVLSGGSGCSIVALPTANGAYFTLPGLDGAFRARLPLPEPCRTMRLPICPGGFQTALSRILQTMSEYAFSVTVRTQHLPDQSDPDRGRYAFAYTITIQNTGEVTAQLISRHWIITDSDNGTQEVSGLGVVGHQPLLKPGEHFEYTSWATISTPVGSMKGEYFCVAEDGHRFEVPIPEFALVLPRMLH